RHGMRAEGLVNLEVIVLLFRSGIPAGGGVRDGNLRPGSKADRPCGRSVVWRDGDADAPVVRYFELRHHGVAAWNRVRLEGSLPYPHSGDRLRSGRVNLEFRIDPLELWQVSVVFARVERSGEIR